MAFGTSQTVIDSASFPALRQSFAGKVFFVGTTSSTTGVSASDSNDGVTSVYPLSTLSQAYAMCKAGRDDVVYVERGYAANVTSAGWLTVAKTGISFIGQGSGDQRPTLTWTATASTILHSATTGANTTWENFIFDFTGITAVVLGIGVAAAGVTFKNCKFIFSATSKIPAGPVLSITGDNVRVENCEFMAGKGITTVYPASHAPIEVNGVDNLRFIGNRLDGYGRVATTEYGLLAFVTTASTRVELRDNHGISRTASSTLWATDVITGTTGVKGGNGAVVNATGTGIGGATIQSDGPNYYWIIGTSTAPVLF